MHEFSMKNLLMMGQLRVFFADFYRSGLLNTPVFMKMDRFVMLNSYMIGLNDDQPLK